MGFFGNAIHEAGWPAWPILVLGIAAVALAIRHAASPQRGQLSLVVGLGLACAFSGVLGTALGVMHSIDGTVQLPPAERWIVLIGLRESLNCIVLSITFVVPAILAATVGAFRLQRRIADIDVRA